jgi:hypothetical protein
MSMVWDMLVAYSLHPEKSHPKHLLWALYFLKIYPKQSPGCSVNRRLHGHSRPEDNEDMDVSIY